MDESKHASEVEVEARRRAKAELGAGPEVHGRGQEVRGVTRSVLVVEDHPALGELIRRFLADAGYRVQVVGSSGEAESLWEREGGNFDLLITDLGLPGKSGHSLAAGLFERKPSLKILYTSGYDRSSGSEKKVEGRYLQKPFSRQDLLDMLRDMFDEPAPAGDPTVQ
ncbi:MAG TPA: response regulator [Fibrobacteria bacterium]|nr:response regulator [Fibrobacteria bacterium]